MDMDTKQKYGPNAAQVMLAIPPKDMTWALHLNKIQYDLKRKRNFIANVKLHFLLNSIKVFFFFVIEI